LRRQLASGGVGINPTSKLMLTIPAGVATWEREIMLERQREGIAKAKAAGKYKGRPVCRLPRGRGAIEQFAAAAGNSAFAELGIDCQDLMPQRASI
jgi:DNA invertase Pin-like site-specific DNA recombinase